jgi:hypothetical protein
MRREDDEPALGLSLFRQPGHDHRNLRRPCTKPAPDSRTFLLEGCRMVAAGYDPMTLRRGADRAVAADRRRA